MSKQSVVLLLFLIILSFSTTQAQEHFEYEQTDANMSILVTDATIDGERLDVGDEIGVFTPGNICAGAVTIEANFANGGEPTGIAAWEADNENPDFGFRINDPLRYRFWDVSIEQEFEAEAEYQVGDGRYQRNGLAVVSLSSIEEQNNFDLTVDPPELDFGDLEVGEFAELVFEVSNTGEEAVTISNAFIDGPDAGSFRYEFEGQLVLEVNEEWDVIVTFAPRAPGEKVAALIIECAEINEPIEIPLLGIAIGNQEPHFEWAITNDNHSILIMEAFLDEELLVELDEVGVFTPDGLCAGSNIVEDEFPIGIAAFGDDRETQEIEGFREQEEFAFRYWDYSAQREIDDVEITVINGQEVYTTNGFTVFQLDAFAAPEPQFVIDHEDHDFGEVEIGDNEIFNFNIGNIGQADLVIEDLFIDSDNFSLETDEELTIAPGADLEFSVTFAPVALGVLESQVYITTNDPQNEFVYLPITGVGLGRELTVPLNEGWNMISINVIPGQEWWRGEEGPDLIQMTDQLRIDEDNHRIEIMKNQFGLFYAPTWDFCNLHVWQPTEGYQVKLTEDFDAVWSGVPIPADTEIPLHRQWNIVAYLPTYELDASAPDYPVLSSILDNLEMAKDVNGQFLVPAENFSNMEPWRETQGYQIKVSQATILSYPPEGEELNANRSTESTFDHWSAPVPTGENMSVLVNSSSGLELRDGWQIAAFSASGTLVGVGTIQDGRCGLAIWGDDPTTETIEGALAGEAFQLQTWDSERELVLDLQVTTVRTGNAPRYETDGFLVLETTVLSAVPDNYYLSQNYPNPFNNVTRIAYGLPEASKVSVQIFDLTGRLVAELMNNQVPAGNHTVVWDASSTSTGIYMVQMETPSGFKAVRKIMLVK